jgi:hypothetical protein
MIEACQHSDKAGSQDSSTSSATAPGVQAGPPAATVPQGNTGEADGPVPVRDDVGATAPNCVPVTGDACKICKGFAGCLRNQLTPHFAACRNVADHLGERCRGRDGLEYTLYHLRRHREAVEEAIRRTLAFFHPEGVIEARILGLRNDRGGRFDAAGYFDSPARAARVLAAYDVEKFPEGIYFVLNPLHPSTIARSPNKISPYLNPLASDRDVKRIRWLFVDCDPERPAGVPSTLEELAASRRLAAAVHDWLRGQGWPEPVRAESGNGFHLLYPLDLPNEPGTGELLRNTLRSIQHHVVEPLMAAGGPRCKVDEKTFNPARIDKLYGTMARKGCAMARLPWRRSRLLGQREV